MLLRWQTSIETPAGFWEIPAEALVHTTCCGLLKQPDKQEVFRGWATSSIPFQSPQGAALSAKADIHMKGITFGERDILDHHVLKLIREGILVRFAAVPRSALLGRS